MVTERRTCTFIHFTECSLYNSIKVQNNILAVNAMNFQVKVTLGDIRNPSSH